MSNRYQPKERVWKQFSNWDEVKEYMYKVEKVIDIDGVNKLSIEFTNYKNDKLKDWRVSVELEMK